MVSFSRVRRSDVLSLRLSAFAFLHRRRRVLDSAVVSNCRMTSERSASFGSMGTERACGCEESGFAVATTRTGSPSLLTLACASAREPRARAPTVARVMLAREWKGRCTRFGSGAAWSETVGRALHFVGVRWRGLRRMRWSSSSCRCPRANVGWLCGARARPSLARC